MVGDYYRYSVEQHSSINQSHVDQSLKFYSDGLKIAVQDLNPCNPVRLGLALNLSILYYEILHKPEKAIVLTTVTLQQAIERIDDLSGDKEAEAGDAHEEFTSEAQSVIAMMTNNLDLWKEELAKAGNAEPSAPDA